MAKNSVENTIKVLSSDGLVVYPSDTVYGLLVDATNEKAVEKLIAFKERPKGKPISVFVADFKMIDDLIELSTNDSERLTQILPGPFTIVLKSKHTVSKLLESEKGTLGIRLPKFALVSDLVKKFGKPVTATSANRSGHPPVHSISALMNQLSEKQKKMIDLVVDVGDLPRNKPSTVVDLTSDELSILREGDLKFTSTKIYRSNSPKKTAEIAKKILREYSSCNKSLAFILEGDLGAGKTQFVKGIAEYLKIQDKIISPTFVVSYEYRIENSEFRNLIHMDLYNVNDAEEFKYLGMDKYLSGQNIFCIEWGEKAGDIIEMLKKNTTLIYTHIMHLDENSREIRMEI